MRSADVVGFCWRSLRGYPLRTGLMLLAMAIGAGSVVVLIALGEGARTYVADRFMSLGTHLLIVLPGRTETVGGPPPMMGETPRDLTLQDAVALLRSTVVRDVAPLVVGSAPLARGNLEREATVLGSTASLYAIRHLAMARGRFLPGGEVDRAEPVCVLGKVLADEVFGDLPPVGQFVRLGDRRFRVIGVLQAMGESLGFDIDEVAVIPVAAAQSLFNQASLFRILVQARNRDAVARAKKAVVDIVRERHDGEEDITVITQDAVLATFDRIFKALTLSLAGIAAISLAVAGVLIMNVMLIAVSQRTAEIGLLKALGAPGSRVMRLFLTEAAMLSLSGALLGLAVAAAGTWGLGRMFPAFPVVVPAWAPLSAVGVALFAGLLFGALPARRAARLDPVAALSRR